MSDIMSQEVSAPGYMYAADAHQVANGKTSIIDKVQTETADFGKFAVSAVARAVTSAFNTVPTVVNWLGADIPELDTYSVLKSFDDDLSAYYNENRTSVDIVGDVAAMFVPGMAGIKGLNYAQKSLSSINAGTSFGKNIAKSFGTLPEAGTKYATLAKAKMAETGNVFNLADGNVIKAFAANYGQAAIEMAAFEVAAAATMDDSPLFKDHTAKDIIYNAALGGGIIGGGIMGSVAAAQTYGQLSRAAQKVGETLAPFRFTKGTEEGVDDFVKILNLRNERVNSPIPEEAGLEPALLKTAQRSLEKRNRDIDIEVQSLLTKISGGDSEVGSQLNSLISVMDQEQTFASLLHLKEISRGGTVGKLEAEHLGKIAAGKESSLVTKYLRTWGEDAGTVLGSQPVALRLADSVANEAELLRDVERRVRQQPAVGVEFNPINTNHFDVEARYIKAFSTTLEDGALIAGKDLPYLEKAVAQQISATVDGVFYDAMSLRNYVKETKLKLADDLADHLAVDPTMNSAIASKLLNVKQSVLEGGGYSKLNDNHFFDLVPGDSLTKPSWVKVTYEGDPTKVGVDGNVMSGMAQIKQLQEAQAKVNNQAAAQILGEETYNKLVRISDDKVLAASTKGAGAGIASMASGEYGTLASTVEWLGKVTSETKQKAHVKINELFQAPAYKVLQNQAAQNEIFTVRQAVLSTGEKYVVDGERVVLKSVKDYELKAAAGKNPVEPVIPPGVVPEIRLTTPESREFLETLVSHNDSYLSNQMTLKNAIGKGMGDWRGVLYFPQPSSKSAPYFSFVVPKNPFEGEKVQMIWARSSDELQRLESSVGMEFNIIRKDDTDKFYKMMKEYDSDLGMNSREFMGDMVRKGTASPFIPKTNADELIQEIVGHYKQASDRQIRDAVTLHNNVAFSQLRVMDSEFKSLQASKKPGAGEAGAVTPYESYVKTALDIPRSSSVPVWTELNNLAENVVSKVFNSLKSTFQAPKTPEEMAALNNHFESHGFRGIKDAYTELIANHPAEKKVLSRFVQSANGLFSTLMLRIDPMNALTNGVGSIVLTGSETKYLTDLIKGNREGASFLRELGEVRLPGTVDTHIKSPTKLIGNAYKSFFDYLTGDVAAVERFKRFEKNGWMPSMMDQLKESFGTLTLTGLESNSQLVAKTKDAMSKAGSFLERATGNRLAEEMNRFVAASIADDIAQAGIKYAGLGEKEANAFVNTFVSRTQGNYVASQRPLMFQGPIGQSISLFQTYMFNSMQHIFRHLSAEGGRKNAAMLLGLQTSIFGMNGLPAFNFLNEHIIGKASGNITHQDAYSVGMDIPGIGDWLLYGGLSNATGLGLYSRGDMNPRNITVVPNSVGDIPFVSATTNFLGTLGKAAGEVAAGGNPTSTILRGIEHAGISRPLAGLAQVLNGVNREDDVLYSTTKNGNVVYAQDLYSLATLGRVAGARPLDEAVARDAYYRVQVYQSQDSAQIAKLGSAIRDKVNSGAEITDGDVESFMESYAKSGKNQANFAKWYQRQVKEAGTNQIGKLIEKGNSSYGQYMQKILKGLDTAPVDLEN